MEVKMKFNNATLMQYYFLMYIVQSNLYFSKTQLVLHTAFACFESLTSYHLKPVLNLFFF